MECLEFESSIIDEKKKKKLLGNECVFFFSLVFVTLFSIIHPGTL